MNVLGCSFSENQLSFNHTFQAGFKKLLQATLLPSSFFSASFSGGTQCIQDVQCLLPRLSMNLHNNYWTMNHKDRSLIQMDKKKLWTKQGHPRSSCFLVNTFLVPWMSLGQSSCMISPRSKPGPDPPAPYNACLEHKKTQYTKSSIKHKWYAYGNMGILATILATATQENILTYYSGMPGAFLCQKRPFIEE